MSGEKARPEQRVDIYQFLDEWFGERFDVKVAQRSSDMPREQIRKLLDDYRSQGSRPAPTIANGELRPLVINDAGFRFALWHSARKEAERPDPLNVLLYAHAVALINPLTEAPKFPFGIGQQLERLAQYRGLAELSAVFWIDPADPYDPIPEGGTTSWRDVWGEELGKRVISVVDNHFDFYMSDFFDVDDLEEMRVDIGIAGLRRIQQILQVDAEGRGQISQMTSFEFEMLRALLQPKPRGADGELRLLSMLISMRGPLLVSPSFSDLESLRRNSDEFFEWRTRLTDALLAVEKLTDDSPDWALVGNRILEEHLAPHMHRLQRELDRSPLRHASIVTTGAATLSGISTLVAAQMGDPASLLPALAGGGAAAGAAGVGAYLKEMLAKRRGRALLTPYVSIGMGREASR